MYNCMRQWAMVLHKLVCIGRYITMFMYLTTELCEYVPCARYSHYSNITFFHTQSLFVYHNDHTNKIRRVNVYNSYFESFNDFSLDYFSYVPLRNLTYVSLCTCLTETSLIVLFVCLVVMIFLWYKKRSTIHFGEC